MTSFTRARIGFFDCGASSICGFLSESVLASWCCTCVRPTDESSAASTNPAAHIVLCERRMDVILLIQERQFLLPVLVSLAIQLSLTLFSKGNGACSLPVT